jgi:N-acylneuraminate cytidylyltransferase
MTIAFIPVRGGSKSIPLKNIKLLCGKPLVYWTAKAACDCSYIDRVFVATEDEAIASTVRSFGLEGLEVVGRSADTASETASTESAMLEFAEAHVFDAIVLIQATSPLLTATDLGGGLNLYGSADTDSVLSVARQKRFHWTVGTDGIATPSNYDYLNRPRRQEFAGTFVENGAFYITSRDRLLKHRCRISGNIRTYEMPEDTLVEIDEPDDWLTIEKIMRRRSVMHSVVMPRIDMFLTDCDGCLTDGGMYYAEGGDEMKRFNTKDGIGLAMLKASGIVTGIVTGEGMELVRKRGAKLGVDIVRVGVKNKLAVLHELCLQYGISPENVAYVGDDINDLEIMEAVGYPCSVADAEAAVLAKAAYVSKLRGGDGAVREIAEHVLAKQ